MATFTLTDLQNEVAKKYASTVVENGEDSYELVNLLQLETKKRKEVEDAVRAFQSDEDTDGGDELENVLKVFRIVTKDNKGDELIDLIGDNPAMYLELFTVWSEGTQLGEV